MRDVIIEMVRQYQRAAEAVEVLEAQRVERGDGFGAEARATALRGLTEAAMALRNVKLPPVLVTQAPRTLGEMLAEQQKQPILPPPDHARPPLRLRDKIARAGLRMVLRALQLDPSPFEGVRRG